MNSDFAEIAMAQQKKQATLRKVKTTAKKKKTTRALTAHEFLAALQRHVSAFELKNYERYFPPETTPRIRTDYFIGVRMGLVFSLAKKFADMDLPEIEKLLNSPIHEARAGAVAVMDFQARSKATPEERKKELYQLYIERHDRINNWDLVDRSAPYVVGGYLFNRPRKVLYKMALSKNPWERRTAIVSTYFFIRKGQTDDTFQIAELMIDDKHEFVRKATGSWLREAGKKDPGRLCALLDKYAPSMPRITLRYAIEKLDPKYRAKYLGMSKAS